MNLPIDFPHTDRNNLKMSTMTHDSGNKDHNTLQSGRTSKNYQAGSIDEVIVEPTHPNKVELVNLT